MNTLLPLDAAYIAGFIDGEGHVSYVKDRYKSKNNYVYYRAIVAITNTNRDVLEWICLALGCGKIREAKRVPGCKQVYTLRWSSRQAVELLEQVLPYLKIKAAQARLILEVVESTYNLAKRVLTDASREKREQVYLAIRTMNQRGDNNAIN